MKFRLFGTEIYVSFLFTAVITVMLATDRTGLILPTLFAVFVHELGHLFVMWATDNEPKQIRLIPASVQIVNGFSKSYKNDLAVAICGPLVNILLFLVFYFNFKAFGNELVLYYALLNLVIAIFNLLPVKGLDGGTIVYSLIASKYGINKAEITVKIFTVVIAISITLVGIFLMLKGETNISLFIIAIYLLVLAFLKR
ncbi:MAG: hypothetical protein E7560_02450 [Ruminococcaceae bacterium]|nr:hypothetical protein [Oscillospiraceae bacterium]